jgi:hypothetical protein
MPGRPVDRGLGSGRAIDVAPIETATAVNAAQVCDRFTEGIDTADLRAARAVLDTFPQTLSRRPCLPQGSLNNPEEA